MNFYVGNVIPLQRLQRQVIFTLTFRNESWEHFLILLGLLSDILPFSSPAKILINLVFHTCVLCSQPILLTRYVSC